MAGASISATNVLYLAPCVLILIAIVIPNPCNIPAVSSSMDGWPRMGNKPLAVSPPTHLFFPGRTALAFKVTHTFSKLKKTKQFFFATTIFGTL